MVLPLLLGLGGSALAGTGAITGLSALTAGALGSGLGSFIETGDLGEGIKTGLMSFAGGKLLGSAMGGAGGKVAAATQNAIPAADSAAAVTEAAKAAQMAANPAGFTMAPSATAGGPPVLTPMTPDTTNFLGMAKAPGSLGFQFENLAGAPDTSSLSKLGKAGLDYASSAQGIGSTIGQSLAYTPPEMEFDDGSDITVPQTGPDDSGVTFPTDGTAGTSEYDYGFGTNYAGGGSLARYARPSMMGFGPLRLAEGGLASLAPEEEMPMPMPMLEMSEAESPSNDKEIIVDAVGAIKDGTPSEENQIVLAAFVQKFGEEALMDLVDSVQKGEFDGIESMGEGLIKGPGDAMDDLVPAENTSSGEDILLSGEEFIVPGDVVSGLGNGSSEAGADELYTMMDRVRDARTGTTEQPPKIYAGGMLPA